MSPCIFSGKLGVLCTKPLHEAVAGRHACCPHAKPDKQLLKSRRLWSRFLANLARPQLGSQFPAHYGALCTTVSHLSLLSMLNVVYTLPLHFFLKQLNTVVLSIPKSSQLSLSLRFPHQAACFSVLHIRAKRIVCHIHLRCIGPIYGK